MIKKISKFSLALFLSTFFYTGLISKKAPGTVGAAFASLCCMGLFLAGLSQYFLDLSCLIFVIGLISSHIFLFKEYGDTNRDPGYIVIDEACGIFIGAAILCLCQELSMITILINFIFFRLFDIWKPFPIRNIDQLCKKSEKTAALGIMLDDILAASMGTTLQLLLFL